MTSWTDLQSSGRGEVVYLLEIVGIGVFTTYDYTPTDSWFTTAGYGASRVYPYLKFDDLGPIDESIDFMEGSLKVEGIGAKIVDVGGAVTALFKDWTARTFTWLTTNASATNTNFAVVDTSQFPSSTSTNAIIYIGQEACTYGSKTGTSFAGLTRGKFGTTARAYSVKLDEESGVNDQPVITNLPHTLVGRRAYLHAAAMVAGAPGSTSVIYRGRIGKGIKVGAGIWDIPIEHISEVLSGKVGQSMPQSTIKPGYYMCGASDFASLSGTIFTIHGTSGAASASHHIVVDAGWYGSPDSLKANWNSKSSATSADILPLLTFTGEKYQLIAAASTNQRLAYIVEVGDPLWCLGFDAGDYEGEYSTAYLREAASEPRLLCVQWGSLDVADVRPAIEVENADLFTAGLQVQIPGNTWGTVYTASGTTVTFEAHGTDPLAGDTFRFFGGTARNAWAVLDEEDDLILKHVFVLDRLTLKDAIKKCLWIYSGQLEPELWCSAGALATDFDFTELDTALGAVPVRLNYWVDCITEGIEVSGIFGPMFGLLGIAPRLSSEGKIGFVRVQTPIATIADAIELDDSMWSIVGAAEIQARLNDSPLINLVAIEHSHDYTEESGGGGSGSESKGWGQPIKIYWRDGWNQLGRTRSVKYQCRGMHYDLAATSVEELAIILNQQVRATHFGIFGRESVSLDVPCTWTAKQILCGDVVKLTHELAPDIPEGTIGMTERLGIVVGASRQTTAGEPEVLTVLITPSTNGAGLAPCALADGWTVGTLTATFSAADTPLYAASGGNDLAAFTAGDEVIFIQRDDTTPTTTTATPVGIVSVDTSGKSVVLDEDPWAGGGLPAGGAHMVFADWDDAVASQQTWAYIADNAASPSLGAGSDTPQEWTI